jgi:hypothetical protein
MWACAVLKGLCSQPCPQEEGERQEQRPGPEVKARARMPANRREALIGRLITITYWPGAVATGGFTRVAETARRSTLAPAAADD